MKNSGVAYLLAMLGFLSPVAGVHRFYLNRPVSGFFYLITWGFLGLGTLIDLFLIPRMVEDENLRLLHPNFSAAAALPAPPSKEQHILRIAQENGGVVTVELVALHSGMTLAEAKVELERLRSAGFCTADVSTEGALLYIFDGLRSIEPLQIEG